ncbi:ABC transporter permease [Ramlibacter sp. XY19]|uniref:ABC transporter permease n=1 Tax=Ramlibacter paludis TaxID=2908000 RepID=UPI0023D9FA30|nr:ABC transporter permease [Ramlibacter paludis]MCG2591238.1 ABC transporter permease [Ramlibacter paludis]
MVIKLRIFYSLVVADLKRRYTGTYLGMAWALAAPLVTIAVLLFVFRYGFRAGPVGGVDFTVWLVVGLIPWFFVNDGLIAGANAIAEYSFLVRKMNFSTEMLPLARICSSLCIHLALLVFMFLLLMVQGHPLTLYWLQLPYYLACLFLLVLGAGVLCSVVQVFVKDFQQIIIMLMQILFWATPVVWEAKILPKEFDLMLLMNPVHYVVQGYRDTFLNGIWFFERPQETLWFWLGTVVLIAGAHTLFGRMKHEFADVL